MIKEKNNQEFEMTTRKEGCIGSKESGQN